MLPPLPAFVEEAIALSLPVISIKLALILISPASPVPRLPEIIWASSLISRLLVVISISPPLPLAPS